MTALASAASAASSLRFWLVMLLAGLLTYAIRLSFILILGKKEIPRWLKRVLEFVPPAVLTAIIFPELFIKDGALAVSASNGRLVAGLVAMVVAWKTKNAVLTIVVGMAALWLIQVVMR